MLQQINKIIDFQVFNFLKKGKKMNYHGKVQFLINYFLVMMKLTFEQIQRAKSVPIMDVLQWFGYTPIKQGKKWQIFENPFRREKTPSFMVCPATNTFRDFGTAESGDVIDLLQKFEGCDFRQAVLKLTNQTQNFSFIGKNSLQKPETANVKAYYLQKLQSLQNVTFLKYIERRKLEKRFAQRYLKEVYYKIEPNQEKNFFGICMENEAKGFEVKNIYSGGYYCLGEKSFSVIRESEANNWLIFEGMFDFIALLTHLQRLVNGNTLVLHSVSNSGKAIEYLQKIQPESIYLFLDNDQAGDEATEKFMQTFSVCKDFRKIYKDCKDLNEMLFKKSPPKIEA